MSYVPGRLFDLSAFLGISIVGVIFIYLSRSWRPPIRKIAATAAIAEAVGRATELGKPVHFTTGIGLGSLNAPDAGMQIVAGLTIFAHLAQLCAKNNTGLIVSVGQPDTIPILEEYVTEAWKAEGLPQPDLVNMIRFHTTEQFSFCAAVTGIMRREQCAANIVVGPLWADSAQLALSGYYTGAMTITGTARFSQLYLIAAFSDYCFIGEELYAAGAQLSNDTETLNTLAAQDVGKLFAIASIIIGSILAALNIDILNKLFGM